MKFLKCEWTLTKRWLQHASILLAAANRLDLRGVHQAPEVVLVVGSIQAQPQTWACQAYHGGYAGGCCVPRVLGLQLHPCLEIVNWRCGALDGGDGQALVVERQQNNSKVTGNIHTVNLAHLSEERWGCSDCTRLFKVFFPTEMCWITKSSNKKIRSYQIIQPTTIFSLITKAMLWSVCGYYWLLADIYLCSGRAPAMVDHSENAWSFWHLSTL